MKTEGLPTLHKKNTMHTPLRVLIVEDSQKNTLLLIDHLQNGGYWVTIERVATPEAFLSAIVHPWDIVIAKYRIAYFSALEALELLQNKGVVIPCIVVSDISGDESIVSAIKAGAYDYIRFHDLKRLVPSVKQALQDTQTQPQKTEQNHALQHSEHAPEEYCARAFHHNPFPICITRLSDGCILEVNQSFLDMTERTHEEVIGHTTVDMGFWQNEHERTQRLQDLQTHRTLHGAHLTFRRSTGEERHILSWMELIEMDNEPCILAMFYDNTERQQAEQHIYRQFRRLAALRRIQMAISASLDLHQMLDQLLDFVTNLLGVDAALVLLLNAQNQTLEYSAGRGFHSSSIRWACLRMGKGYAGRAALAQRPVSIPDIRQSTLQDVRSRLLLKEGFVSYYGVPLVARGQVKGVLELFLQSAYTFDEEWLDFLEALSGQTAIAIDNAELVRNIQNSRDELAQAYEATIEGWVRALDLRDNETEGHSQRVTEMTVKLAQAMGFGDDELVHIRRGALLHDIGKMGIPDTILRKPGPLDEEEWAIMRKHPEYAYAMLRPIAFLRPALDIPYCHHEKWDGSGYPRELRGTDIPLTARIFSVVDVWDALRYDRPYRKGWPEEKVIAHICNHAGSHFDPHVVEVFVELMKLHYSKEDESVLEYGTQKP